MSFLAIDFGEKYIGLAVSDPKNRIALGLATLENKSETEIVHKLSLICRERLVEKIIIGLPKSLSGGDSEQTKKVRKFAEYVKIKLGLPVVLEDERLTSKQAQKLKVSDLDQMSACLILQTYLDRAGNL